MISSPSRGVSVMLYFIRGFLVAVDIIKYFYKFHTVSFTNNVYVIFVKSVVHCRYTNNKFF